MICKLFTDLLKYRFIEFILFDGTNRICVCKTKLGRASTRACSSSAMLEQHCSNRSTKSNMSSRDVTSQVEFGLYDTWIHTTTTTIVWHWLCWCGQRYCCYSKAAAGFWRCCKIPSAICRCVTVFVVNVFLLPFVGRNESDGTARRTGRSESSSEQHHSAAGTV